MTTERDIEDLLQDLLMDEEGVARVDTFEQAALLTQNRGIVLRMEWGAEFQITIVQSKEADR